MTRNHQAEDCAKRSNCNMHPLRHFLACRKQVTVGSVPLPSPVDAPDGRATVKHHATAASIRSSAAVKAPAIRKAGGREGIVTPTNTEPRRRGAHFLGGLPIFRRSGGTNSP